MSAQSRGCECAVARPRVRSRMWLVWDVGVGAGWVGCCVLQKKTSRMDCATRDVCLLCDYVGDVLSDDYDFICMSVGIANDIDALDRSFETYAAGGVEGNGLCRCAVSRCVGKVNGCVVAALEFVNMIASSVIIELPLPYHFIVVGQHVGL